MMKIPAPARLSRFCFKAALAASFLGMARADEPEGMRHQARIQLATRAEGAPSAQWESHVDHADPNKDGVRYTCPMHPEVVRDTPGRCPHCGMKLVEVEPSPGVEEAS